MRVALGFKAHSGWAALVAIGEQDGEVCVVDRRRVELVERDDAPWARQPYHEAQDLEPAAARRVVERGIDEARRSAVRELRAALSRARAEGHDVAACAVLSVDPMPPWTVEEILAVHFRMHKAEGVLYRDVLARAAKTCRIKLVEVPERSLGEFARLEPCVLALGRTVGAPWGRDQKDAAMAALVALHRA